MVKKRSLFCVPFLCYGLIFNPFRRFGRSKSNQPILCLCTRREAMIYYYCFKPYGAYVTILCPPSFPPMSHLCAQIRDYYVRIGNDRSTTTKPLKTWTILLHSAKSCKRTGSQIRKLRAFKDSNYTFGARVRKTAGTRSCCIPELLRLRSGTLLPNTKTPAPRLLAVWV